MKKILLLVILVLGLISCNKKSTEAEARKILHSHLEQRYGEPFWIGPMGIRATDEKMWYEAEIMPSKYIGTPKDKDKYYHPVGTVRINKNKWGGENLGKGSDVYMSVRLNESANEYFLPKLQELFGNQVLPVIQMRVWEVEDNGGYIKTYEHNKREKGYFFIQGGIYIFTRIDDLETKERYRKKIYNFIQYIKSQDMFWQVNLVLYFIDERILTDEFYEKSYDKNLLSFYSIEDGNFLKKRRILLSSISESSRINLNILENQNKNDLLKINNKLFLAGTIELFKILTRDYIELNPLFEDGKSRLYDSVESIKFEEEINE